MRTRARDSIVMDQMNRDERITAAQTPRDRVRDQAYIKQYNIQTVLALLKKCQPISRTDIARITCMSPTSITRIVGALINQGLIYEGAGDQRSGRGRKATHLRINADGLYAIGIHLEKSIICLCVTNFADEALYKVETLVDGECTPERMAHAAKALFDRMPDGVVPHPERISAVAVTLPGSVNPWNGTVKCSERLMWQNENVSKAFADAFGLPAFVENDVKACLISEKVRLKIADSVDTVYLLADSDLCMAATSDGILLRGVENEAGQISHIPLGLLEDGSTDYLYNHLVEERIVRRAQHFDPSVHSLDGILRAQAQGQAWAQNIIDTSKHALCLTAHMISGILNPTQIILGGSLFTRLCELFPELLKTENVCLGARYEESAMIGAAYIAMRSAAVELIGQTIE